MRIVTGHLQKKFGWKRAITVGRVAFWNFCCHTMLTKISICLNNFQIRNFEKRTPTLVKAVTWKFLKKFGWKKNSGRRYVLQFAPLQCLMLTKKKKKIVKIQDFKILKKIKKKPGDIVDSYKISTRFDAYSLKNFWEWRLNGWTQKQGLISVYYNLWLYTTRTKI